MSKEANIATSEKVVLVTEWPTGANERVATHLTQVVMYTSNIATQCYALSQNAKQQ